MSLFSKTYHRIRLLTAALLLPLLCACSYMSEETEEPTAPQSPTADYININIVVSSGNEGTTRAPLGGENGDGREAGSERENKVTGITLMLYKSDADGINTANAENIKIDYVQYFPTMKLDHRDAAGTNYDRNKNDAEAEKSGAIEVKYTTGEQPLGSGIDKNTEYHVIVVANWDLRDQVTAGTTTLDDVRELTASDIYTGDCIGINPASFLMASEADHTINLSDLTPETSGNKRIYKIENAIRIERLAARVDFWMKGAEYKTSRDNPDYTIPGYEYSVTKSDGASSLDKFVLTAVMPFNLYNADEFFIKHVNRGDGTITYLDKYLENETGENFVIDPKTKDKSGQTKASYYNNPLDGLVSLQTGSEKKETFAGVETVAKYYQPIVSLYGSNQKAPFKNGNDEETENYILCYPKENTLKLSSELYYYATGVAIEGDYYHYNATTKTYERKHLVYYGYLRHQGEPYDSGTYPISTAEELSKDQNATGSQSTPMNFGVVRNNIYRISIDKITEKGEEPPKITWQIKVKNWDMFKHGTIYM